jgi:hypothetical protein
MYALYAPNLPMYAQPLGIGATLPGSDPHSWGPSATLALTSGAAALRAQPCYSQELSDCINTTATSSVPNCQAIRDGYKVDAKAMDAAAEGLKFCPASSTPSLGTLIAVGGIGVALGVLLGGLLR